MKWYRKSGTNDLINLNLVQNIYLLKNKIYFYFSGQDEGIFITETFDTEERAEKCFNKIAEKLGTDDFYY